MAPAVPEAQDEQHVAQVLELPQVAHFELRDELESDTGQDVRFLPLEVQGRRLRMR
jgi:hypothetical protein